jgi:phosphate starvation-inducible protein PhoH
MMMLTTRIGEDSRMVITGDLAQSDRVGENGLSDFMKKMRKYNSTEEDASPYIRIVEMNNTDIQRSPIVSKVLEIYSQGEENEKKNEKNKKAGFDDSAMIPINLMRDNFML